MKEPKIAYFSSESNFWDQIIGYTIDNGHKITKAQIQPALDKGDAYIYTLSEFCAAFNDEAISDQGVILQLIEE